MKSNFDAFVWAIIAVSPLAIWLEVNAAQPSAAVAVSHRHTQARTDAQPALKDDLASQKPDTGNSSATPNSSPDLGEVIGAHLQASVPEFTVHMADFPCTPCEQLKRTLADMGERVRVTYVLGGEAQYPALKYAGRTWYGALSAAQIDAIAREYNPPAIPQAVSIGRIQLKSAIAALLDKVQSDRSGAAVVTLGSASVLLPASMPMTVSATHEHVSVVFTGARPRARYALLGCDITGIVATRDLLVISLDRMPELSMEVVGP